MVLWLKLQTPCTCFFVLLEWKGWKDVYVVAKIDIFSRQNRHIFVAKYTYFFPGVN